MKKIIIVNIIAIFGFCNISNSQIQEKQSLSDFSNGKVIKYSTNGLGKSQGLKVHIKYPSSWRSMEGERPHIMHKFIQPDGYVMAMLIINKFDEPLHQNEINEFFTPNGLKSMIPKNSQLISYDTNLKIEGLKAGSIDYRTSALRMNRQFDSYSRSYVFLYNDYFIMIQFMVINKINELNENVHNRFNILKPLFYQMFNSIVIDNIWE